MHGRKYNPLTAEHPLVTGINGKRHHCPGCGSYFHTGDETCLVVGDDVMAVARRVGERNVEAKPYHWRCKPAEATEQ